MKYLGTRYVDMGRVVDSTYNVNAQKPSDLRSDEKA